MHVLKSGFILYTIKYEECVLFYEKILELKVLYRKEILTCFEFYGNYLMVEITDDADELTATIPSRDRTCIRLNVADVREACKVLHKNSIEYSYGEYEWGTIAKFRDPDGNLIGFRSAKEHLIDIEKNDKTQ